MDALIDYYYSFFFAIYPYICLAIFVLGCLVRYEREQYSWRASSSQLLADRGLRVGNILFHIGILVIFAGHLFGLLTPHAIYGYFIADNHKQLLAIIVGGVAGIMVFVGLSILIYRRLFVPRIRSTSAVSDIMVIIILWIQVTLGLLTIPFSLGHEEPTTMLNLASWAQYVLTFRADPASFVRGTDWVFQVHIILGLTIFLLFPFTRLVHMLSAPLEYLWRPYQVVRSREARR